MYRKILVPVDGSQLAECVFPHLEALVRGCVEPPEVVFVTVLEPMRVSYGGDFVFPEEDVRRLEAEHMKEAGEYLERVVSARKGKGMKASHAILKGQAAETIADYAAKHGVDIIVLATHGRSGVTRWVLGSVADRLVRSSCIPVLLVRAPGCAIEK